MPEDRSAITFRLDPRARFSDGKPVTAADVRFTFELLRERGRPNYRNSYAKVARVDTPDAHTIRFDLAGADDRELPLILGIMPVLAAACHRPRRLRRDVVPAAARLRPLQGGERAAGREHHLSPRSRLLGRASARQPRHVQCRRGPLRLLPGCEFPVRGVQGGALRLPRRDRPDALAQGLRHPGRPRRPHRPRSVAEPPAEGHVRLRLQHAAAALRRRAGARGARLPVRFRMDQQDPVRRRLPAHGKLFRGLARPLGARAAGRCGRARPASPPIPEPSGTTSSRGAGSRLSPTAPDATGRRRGGPWRCSPRPAFR